MISNFCYDVYTVFWRDWVVFKKIFFKFLMFAHDYAFFVLFLHFGIRVGEKCFVFDWWEVYLSFLIPGMIALNSMNISFNIYCCSS